MTAKAVTISSDSFRPSYFARNLYPTTNPLRSFTVLSVRKRVYVIISLIVAAVAAFLAFTQVFGEGGSNDSGNSASGNTSSSSDHQSSNSQSSQSSSSSSNSTPNESTGNSSNSNSTSVTVNGQSVVVPQTGSYDKNVSVPGGNVHVSGNSSQSTTGNSSSNSTTTNVEINSE
jgi:cytoskeletal protein RodZ